MELVGINATVSWVECFDWKMFYKTLLFRDYFSCKQLLLLHHHNLDTHIVNIRVISMPLHWIVNFICCFSLDFVFPSYKSVFTSTFNYSDKKQFQANMILVNWWNWTQHFLLFSPAWWHTTPFCWFNNFPWKSLTQSIGF